MLDDPCLLDAAPYPVLPSYPPPHNHTSLALLGAQRRVAIATAVHQPSFGWMASIWLANNSGSV